MLCYVSDNHQQNSVPAVAVCLWAQVSVTTFSILGHPSVRPDILVFPLTSICLLVPAEDQLVPLCRLRWESQCRLHHTTPIQPTLSEKIKTKSSNTNGIAQNGIAWFLPLCKFILPRNIEFNWPILFFYYTTQFLITLNFN